ncbi:maleylpyruvate isomerase family mycothiol-dependent enzyme [Nocardioides bruguierae]|uniref:Maleylpyruvate isomerase family mycothiol-dependent enzyme n=1 Tax=Nocardioides bruguierae TaxID=2945102 RepID=A0A9X2DA57_9ACTN|nr:maleylpyruvate isomerase family mycothiol-dependent enzyme [Nocardioides bruguierae]MCM0622168.1 maleylpyruvate isomerase family mycothiol-dependent enzyme [Nocardioides bruguierae]
MTGMTGSPTSLPTSAYLNHLVAESSRFRDVLAARDPAARVPSCPDWDADDLLWHLTEVQWFWSQVIVRRPAGPPDDADRPARPEAHADLVSLFDACSSALSSALAAADPGEAAWSWAEEQTVGFTVRRQAHEALIHRLDAEQAAGTVTPLPPDLAADGVAELMDVMYGGEPPSWATFTPDGHATTLRLTDTGHTLRVVTGHLVGTSPDGWEVDGPHLVLRPDDAAGGACEVAGTAAVLDAWLWRRTEEAGVTVTGSQEAYAAFRAAVDAPLT